MFVLYERLNLCHISDLWIERNFFRSFNLVDEETPLKFYANSVKLCSKMEWLKDEILELKLSTLLKKNFCFMRVFKAEHYMIAYEYSLDAEHCDVAIVAVSPFVPCS